MAERGGGNRAGFGMARLPSATPKDPDPPDHGRAALGEVRSEGPLPPGSRIDLAAERTRSEVDLVLGRLEAELVGLAPVKTRVREIASLLLVDRARRRFGLDSSRP